MANTMHLELTESQKQVFGLLKERCDLVEGNLVNRWTEAAGLFVGPVPEVLEVEIIPPGLPLYPRTARQTRGWVDSQQPLEVVNLPI